MDYYKIEGGKVFESGTHQRFSSKSYDEPYASNQKFDAAGRLPLLKTDSMNPEMQ
ncbi:MAG: hypothetical protein U5N58_01760 [Actinomycetota bacterium]|nr:hypothetical protein [Actinomycetota bacterium]